MYFFSGKMPIYNRRAICPKFSWTRLISLRLQYARDFLAKPEILWIIKIVSRFTRPARPSLFFFFVVVKGNGTSLCSNKEMVSHKKRQS
jgi:hypothetical protein